jgi:hypothetical protein
VTPARRKSCVRASVTLSRDFRNVFDAASPLLAELAEWAQTILHHDAHETIAPLHMEYRALRILNFRALLRSFNRTEVQVDPEDHSEWDAAKAHPRQLDKLPGPS